MRNAKPEVTENDYLTVTAFSVRHCMYTYSVYDGSNLDFTETGLT